MLAKNSDREPNEAQYLTQVAAGRHAPGALLRCTYIDIPQVARTYAVLGSRPWWMWGFEHGVNECGVAIGNEAVWSRLPAGEEPGLLGMDLLRLGLERAATADEALQVITVLLERYGQSGRCAQARDMFYHNSFIIADPARAWVLQTAGEHWVAKRVAGTASISNVYSIHADCDRISPNAIAYATAQGWYDPAGGAPFDFAAAYADTTLAILPACQARFAMSQTGLQARTAVGKVRLEDLFALLRSHGGHDAEPDWAPGHDSESVLCMHAGTPEGFETAASIVAELPAVGSARPLTYWGSLVSPCLSSFVPIWPDCDVPASWTQPRAGQHDQWWTQERTQREIERDYAGLAGAPRHILQQLERRAVAAVRALDDAADARSRAAVTDHAVAEQVAAWRIIEPTVRALIDGPLAPRSDDPRGDYLDEVNTTIPLTTCVSGPATAELAGWPERTKRAESTDRRAK
jgi:dipeptidase